MQKEVKRRQFVWDFPSVARCIVRYRGDYFHSKKRTKVLEQRDQFFKHMAAFTRAVCCAYCGYVIYTENKTDKEKAEYVAEEIQRLNIYWNPNTIISTKKNKQILQSIMTYLKIPRRK